jgi:hypothetical protein
LSVFSTQVPGPGQSAWPIVATVDPDRVRSKGRCRGRVLGEAGQIRPGRKLQRATQADGQIRASDGGVRIASPADRPRLRRRRAEQSPFVGSPRSSAAAKDELPVLACMLKT